MPTAVVSPAPAPDAVNASGAADTSTPLIVRKFKASELPLSSATRSAIEGLTHSFKKKGGYDTIRKQVWDKFEASVCIPRTVPHNSSDYMTSHLV